jgi:hypothetical protein
MECLMTSAPLVLHTHRERERERDFRCPKLHRPLLLSLSLPPSFTIPRTSPDLAGQDTFEGTPATAPTPSHPPSAAWALTMPASSARMPGRRGDELGSSSPLPSFSGRGVPGPWVDMKGRKQPESTSATASKSQHATPHVWVEGNNGSRPEPTHAFPGTVSLWVKTAK